MIINSCSVLFTTQPPQGIFFAGVIGRSITDNYYDFSVSALSIPRGLSGICYEGRSMADIKELTSETAAEKALKFFPTSRETKGNRKNIFSSFDFR
jgi:hypothetical protein